MAVEGGDDEKLGENGMPQAVAAPKPMRGADDKRARLLVIIKQRSLLKGEFKLASGAKSDYYLDMKPTTFHPEGAALLAEIIYDMVEDDRDVSAIGGLELGAVPIVAAVCAHSWNRNRRIAGFVVRKERKGHGTDRKIDGNFERDSTVVLLDDVTTKGGSVMQAVHAVREQGAKVKKIITVVDRGEGAAAAIREAGIEFQPIFTRAEILG
jgi:orotate phosphoribosyltransferase